MRGRACLAGIKMCVVSNDIRAITGPVLGAHQDTRRVCPHEPQGAVHDIGAGMHSGIATQHVAWTALTTYEPLTESLRGYVRWTTASNSRHQYCVFDQSNPKRGQVFRELPSVA